jgi:Bacterial PH domain
VGLKDSLKNAKDNAISRHADARDAARQKADERSAGRATLHELLQTSCPLPIDSGDAPLPGGQRLLDDEFLVTVGKEWGMSSEKMTLTTHRIIYTHGRISKDMESVYLTDVRDVRYHKPAIGHGSLVIDTASGKIEGLPASSNARQLRDRMLQLVHWARQRAQQPQVVHAPAAPEDIPGQLATLAQLRDGGVLSDEEFATSKTALLARI